MATRNFYERDSVAAQLLWSLFHGEPETATAAAFELIASDESELLFAYLTLAWWLQTPSRDGIQKARLDAFLTQDPLRFLSTLLPAPGTHVNLPPLTPIPALPPPQVLGKEAPPPATWAVWPAGWETGQAGKYWRALEEALRKGNFRRATFLTLSFSDQTAVLVDLFKAQGLPGPLLEALESTLFQPLIPRIIEHCFACCCCSAAVSIKAANPVSVGRCFRISAAALTCWGVRAPQLARLRGPPLLVTDGDATMYWKKAVSAVKDHGFNPQKPMLFEECADADLVEGFYETHFPYDIPEEWTRAEMEKSHFTHPVERSSANPWILAFCV